MTDNTTITEITQEPTDFMSRGKTTVESDMAENTISTETEDTKLTEITQEPMDDMTVIAKKNDITPVYIQSKDEALNSFLRDNAVKFQAPTKEKQEKPASIEAEEGAFDFINTFDDEQAAADAKAKTEADAKAEMLAIYDAAIVRMADGISFEDALAAEVAVAAKNVSVGKEIIANIIAMVADKNEKMTANRTISDEASAKIAAATEQGKHDREAYELAELLEIVENLRKGKKVNGLKDDQIIDRAVDLYLLEGGHVKGYEQMNDEQRQVVHDAYAARIAKFEEIDTIKAMEKAEAEKQNKPSVLSTVIKFVKDHKEVIVAACGVAVAALAATSILSPTGLLGLPTVALGATSSAIFPPIFLGAATIATVWAGAKLVNKLVKNHAEKAAAKAALDNAKVAEVGKENAKANDEQVATIVGNEKSAEQAKTADVAIAEPKAAKTSVGEKVHGLGAAIRKEALSAKEEFKRAFAKQANEKVNG